MTGIRARHTAHHSIPVDVDCINAIPSQLRTTARDALIIDRAEGVHVFDHTGKGYYDAMAGYWLACLGYGDAELIDVMTQAATRLSFWHQFDTSHTAGIEYVRELFTHLPRSLGGKVLFANTGSGAIENALRAACARVALDKRPAIIAHLDRSYHGSTFLAQQLSPFNDWPDSLRLAPWQLMKLGSPSSVDAADQTLAGFEACLRGPKPPTILITEPVQGVGGMIVPPSGFFEEIARLCRKHEVVWISDEISTGFGSTGKLFAFELDGALPDILVIGKKMAAGYFPMSAAIVSAELSEQTVSGREFHYGYSTSGHPVGCAVATTVLQRIAAPEMLAHVSTLGEQLRNALDHRLGPVSGVGLMLTLDVRRSRTAAAVARKLRDLGVYELPEGRYLTFCPPFISSE